MPNQDQNNQQSNSNSANDFSNGNQGGGIMGYTSPYANQTPFTQLTPQNSPQMSTPTNTPSSNQTQQAQPASPANNSQTNDSPNIQDYLNTPGAQSASSTANQVSSQVTANPAEASLSASSPVIQPEVIQPSTQSNPETQNSSLSSGDITGTKTDNLLDDPDQVHAILNDGASSNPISPLNGNVSVNIPNLQPETGLQPINQQIPESIEQIDSPTQTANSASSESGVAAPATTIDGTTTLQPEVSKDSQEQVGNEVTENKPQNSSQTNQDSQIQNPATPNFELEQPTPISTNVSSELNPVRRIFSEGGQTQDSTIGLNAPEIPDFLQDPLKVQMDVQDQLRKEKEALAKKDAEEKAKLEAEERAKQEKIAAEKARLEQLNSYQAPSKKPQTKFGNSPMPSQPRSQLNPERDLAMMATSTNSSKKYTNITELLDIVIEKNASDLHITVGYPPFIRIDDKLIPAGATLGKEDLKTLVSQSLTQNQKELLEVNREVDLSYQHKNAGRFRINAYYERGNLAAAYRLIPQRIRTVTELNLPNNLIDFTRLAQGLFLVTGPTGSGKSTTLAAMLQHINETTPKHIITIEDPIEYVYPRAMSLVDQRELGSDTHDWSIALKSALRQDPDVILIGELRDFDTIQSAITLAETGHLVFATLHTNSAAQSIDRIIDVFPPHQQQQIKTQLAGSLKGILSQRLIPLIGGGRKAVIELLIVTPAVQNLIREGKTYQIDNVISTSADLGMISLEKSLVKLVREGKITGNTAQDYAIRPEEILKLMKNNQL
jgi:twitching motility protein PilT